MFYVRRKVVIKLWIIKKDTQVLLIEIGSLRMYTRLGLVLKRYSHPYENYFMNSN